MGRVSAGIFVLAAGLAVAAEAPSTVLALHPENPHYFVFRGKPAVLITSGEHYGAVLNLDFDYGAYLQELAAHGFNHTRLFSGTYCEREDSFGITDNTLAPKAGRFVCPWARSDKPGAFDGGNKFDLSRWDEKYFKRLKDFVREAGSRGVVVEVNLFCTMYSDALWQASPMHATNNVNGIGHVGKYEVYALKEETLTKAQEAVTRKIVTVLNEFDNVYYEVCNEPYERGGMHAEWQPRIIAAIQEAERDLPRKHLISLNDENRSGKIKQPHPAVSIYNFHAATAQAVTMNYGLNKALGLNETGGSARDDETYRIQGWEFMLAGGALFSHLDFSFGTAHPRGTLVNHKSPGGGGRALRKQLAVLKSFLESFDFVKLKPANATIKGGLPEKARAYVLAEPGRQYAIYITGGGQGSLSVDLPPGKYRAEWIDPVTGRRINEESTESAGQVVRLAVPAHGRDIALRLRRSPGK